MDGVCDIVQEAVIKTIPKKKKHKKANLMDIRDDNLYLKDMKTVDTSLSSFQKYKWCIKYN